MDNSGRIAAFETDEDAVAAGYRHALSDAEAKALLAHKNREERPALLAAMRRKTIAVDFDGVLHAYTSPWTRPEEINDGPVPGAIEFLCATAERFEVVIFSVRATEEDGRHAIMGWLAQHGLPPDVATRLRLTCEKPKAVVYLDDRAWRFDGAFPSLDALDAFVPWNRRATKAE